MDKDEDDNISLKLSKKIKVSEDDWKVTNFKINQWDVSAKEEIDGKIYWNTHTACFGASQTVC